MTNPLPELIHTAAELRERVAAQPASKPCQCALSHCAGWESITEERWPAEHLEAVATLRDTELYEPTFEEYHPTGTRYASPEAPIALKFYPFNRCDVWRCKTCNRHVLRYTEAGGYYVDHRVRILAPALIAD